MVQGLSLELIMSGIPNDCKTMDWQSVPYTFLLFFLLHQRITYFSEAPMTLQVVDGESKAR